MTPYTVTDKLQFFLRDASTKKFRLSEWDCGMWLADWYMIATGKSDPAYDLRRRPYKASSIVSHLRRIVRRTGLARTRTPQAGDVGLIRIGNTAHGAIFTGSRWALLGERGLSSTPSWYPCMAAWRVE